MATNDNRLPLVAGKLPKECYASAQELVDDLPKVLSMPQDNVEIIKGATGPPGPRGTRGDRGEAGAAGVGISVTQSVVSIPNGVIYVEFDYFLNWENAVYKVKFNGFFAAGVGETDFNPASGIVAVGTLVPVYNVPSPTKVRCYFVFAGGITQTPNANFRLHISRIESQV